MKKKVFLTAALLCAFSLASFAQLTTGEPSAKKIRTGNRAQAGDFGLYIGFPINNYVDDIKRPCSFPNREPQVLCFGPARSQGKH